MKDAGCVDSWTGGTFAAPNRHAGDARTQGAGAPRRPDDLREGMKKASWLTTE